MIFLLGYLVYTEPCQRQTDGRNVPPLMLMYQYEIPDFYAEYVLFLGSSVDVFLKVLNIIMDP